MATLKPFPRAFLFAAALGMLCFGARAADNTIVILGSSTAEGQGASTYDSAFAGRYAKYLAGLNPAWKLVNYGVGGYTTYNVMPTGWKHPTNRPGPDTSKNITKALSLKPTAMIICLPSNDINNGYPASEYNANFDSLHAWATAAKVPVWVTTPLPRTALSDAGRKLLLELRDRNLSHFAPRSIDFYTTLGDADGKYVPEYNSGDGIHTNNKGHLILFNRTVAANLTGVVTSLASAYAIRSAAPRAALSFDARTGVLSVANGGMRFDPMGRGLVAGTRGFSLESGK